MLGHGLFEDITGDAGLLHSRNDERRGWPRVPIGLRGTIQLHEAALGAQPMTVVVRDISRKGVGLLCPDEVEPGKAFMLKLRIKDADPVDLPCVVTRCERGGMGASNFVLGANFNDPGEFAAKASIVN